MWDHPEEFMPERFPLDGAVPNEQNTDYRYIPFSAGPRSASNPERFLSTCGLTDAWKAVTNTGGNGGRAKICCRAETSMQEKWRSL